jgi:hypothetical protein
MSTEARDAFFQTNKERLEQLAYRAIQKGLTPHQFITLCIDVDDPSWTDLVDVLMPDYDWQAIRDRGEKPVARGPITSEIVDYLSQADPTIAPELLDRLPPPGLTTAVVMSDGGASVYYIQPTPQYKNN